MIYRFFCALLTLFTLGGATAFAAEPDQVEVALHAFQVVSAEGGKRVPATVARPGDVIEYQITYRNAGRAPARRVAATLPVPDGGMAYLDGSAAPGPFQASLDGVHYAAPPLRREVVRDGRRLVETVPPADYRFLRWNLGDLAPNQTATVVARMRLAPPADPIAKQ